ncbi:unnamed protein product, partial [Tetraodon nigroviridis]
LPRVLLFPPLPSRLRYLIHSHVEDLPDLTTFSVGERWCRRVVVCYSGLRGQSDEEGDVDPESNHSFSEEPTMSKDGKHEEETPAKPKTSSQAHHRGPKRPDKPLFMPRAVRERLSSQNSQQPVGDRILTSPAADGRICRSPEPETGETTESPPMAAQEGAVDAAEHLEDSPAFGAGGADPESWESPPLSLAHMTLGHDEDKEVSDLTQEIKTHLKECSTVAIEHAHNDYFAHVNVDINPEEFRHVIEIFGFPPTFKTDDLLDAFADYSNGGIKIKWIDGTRALGVFASESAANLARSIVHPMLKARSLAEGSKKAKAKAFRSAEFIQPVKERPKTDCAVAQRMVTRALGLQKRRYGDKSPTPVSTKTSFFYRNHQSQSLASENFYLFKNVMQTSVKEALNSIKKYPL